MKDLAELLRAIAALLWPVLAFTAVFAFRAEFRSLLGRLRKGKLLGQEIELAASLDRLEAAASAAASEVAALPPAPEPSEPSAKDTSDGSDIGRILSLSGQSPKAALLLLASEMEREVRQLVARLGLLKGRRTVSLREGIVALQQWDGLPVHVPSSVEQFYKIRSRLVHGQDVTNDDVLRGIDSGVTILRTLEGIPRETNVVYHPGVEIFSDAACTQRIDGAKGVILETKSPGGTISSRRIFPSTREHFRRGKVVAWEWSDEHQFGPAWYRDPESKEIKEAWSSSLEFVGRHLEDI